MGKIKIHELAKEIGMSSKDVLEKAKSLGIDVTSHLSNVTDEQATEIRNAYSKNNKNMASFPHPIKSIHFLSNKHQCIF